MGIVLRPHQPVWDGRQPESFWLAVSLNVSVAHPELCRATACIAAVTCMGGLWEMERFQLKRAASVLPIWKRRGAESLRLQPSQLYVVRGSSTTDLAVKGHNSRFSTQPHLVPSTCYYCWILLKGRCVLWNKQSKSHKHWNTAGLAPVLTGCWGTSKFCPRTQIKEGRDDGAETCHW